MAQESRYSKVFVKIWHSKDFRMLSEEGKMLFLYLLTSPHRNMGGFYYLPFPYLCFDIGLDENRVAKAFEELEDRGMAVYDKDAQVVLIKKWFCYNPIENANQAKGLNKQLAEIPKSKLFESFVNCVKEHCKYTETILKGFDIPFSNPSETLPKPYAKPGTGTGTGTESVTEECIQSAPAEPTKHKADQQAIFDHWNQQGIIKHRTLNDKIKRAISGALRDYSVDEIKQAISNYAEILRGEQYYFSYKWTLKHFLQRGLEQFLEWEVCLKNYARGDPLSADVINLQAKKGGGDSVKKRGRGSPEGASGCDEYDELVLR